jgi:predicted DNA-binding transcriptional regulator YafY
MPRTTSEQVAARVLALAAYIRHERTFTLDRATLDVPGYPEADRLSDGEKLDTSTPAYEALRSTFRRDLDVLKADFGIEAPYDSLATHYALNPPFFTPTERRALVAATAAVEVTLDGDSGDDPERLGAAVDDDEAEVFLVVTDTIRQLIDASHRRRVVQFTYKDTTRRVEPWAVGAWRRHWYVVGRDLDARDQRTYRIERLRDLEVRADEFEVPGDFDRQAALNMDPNRWGKDPRVTVTLHVEPAFAPRLAYALGGEITGEHHGRTVVETESGNRDALFDRMLELGNHVQIVAPTSVVDEFRDRLRAMADLR